MVPCSSQNNPTSRTPASAKTTDDFMDPRAYVKAIPKLFETVRKTCGEEVELLHDTHERVQPQDMINMCKRLEEFDPYWIEDPLTPEKYAPLSAVARRDHRAFRDGRTLQQPQ